jgi:hypothetical protein
MADGEQVVKQAVDLLLRAAPAGSKVILDFMVVEPQVENRYAESVRLREALRPVYAMFDVLVVSAKVFQEWADTPNTVIYEAAREGKVYEQVV